MRPACRPILAVLLVVAFAAAACAPLPPAPPHVTVGENLAGWIVTDAKTGQVLDEHDPDKRFIPASTAKLAGAFAALRVLGPGFRFTTTLRVHGHLKSDGTLTGNLWLVGGGAPLLGLGDLAALATRLHDLGIRRIDGAFFFDESLFPPVRRIDPAQPAEAPYNAAISPLSLDYNRARVTWTADRAYVTPPTVSGASLPATREPAPPGVALAFSDGRWQPTAEAGPEGSREVPLTNPGLATARTFRRLAAEAGVSLPAPAPGKAPANSVPVARLSGVPLLDVLRPALEYSNNVIAELIGQRTALAIDPGKPPRDLASGTARTTAWMEARLPKVDWTGFTLANHSGLSTASRVTPRQMAALVRAAVSQRYAGWPFRALLPTAGQRDAFSGRFRQPETALRLWAKTGTMNYASGLVGILVPHSGRHLAIAVYVTDFDARGAYDANPARQGAAAQRRVHAWIAAAKKLEETLVERWIARY